MTSAFSGGLRAGVPVAFSITASFLAVGVYLNQAGIALVPSVAMTAVVFAGPAQYGVAQAIQNSTSVISTLGLVALINLRFFVMASSLVEKFRTVSLWRLAIAVPFLSASTFAVSQAGADEERLESEQRFQYFVGVGLIGYITAIFATLLGASLLSQYYAAPKALLTMILPFFFAAQAGSGYKNQSRTLSFLMGLILAWLFFPLFGSHSVLLASLTVGAISATKSLRRKTCPAHG